MNRANKLAITSLIPVMALVLPAVTYATTLDDIILKVKTWVGTLIPIVFALCLLVFIWGLVTFIASSGNEEARTQGKQRMLWGIIALFVAASIWGVVAFIGDSLGINRGDPGKPPGIPGYNPS